MKYRSKYDASLPCKEYMAKIVVQNYQCMAECLCVRPSLQIVVIQLRFFLYPQSRQSSRLFLQPSELGTPQPLTPFECVPPPLWLQGGHTRLRERGGVPIRTRGQTLWYSRYIFILCLYPYFVPVPLYLLFDLQRRNNLKLINNDYQ
jgi:hypothetical protein